MKKEPSPEESFHIIRQELITVSEKLEELSRLKKDVQDISFEIKGIMLFLGRVYPDFREQFPVIMKKVTGRT